MTRRYIGPFTVLCFTLSFGAWSDEPHPQDTYGSIDLPASHADAESSCSNRWGRRPDGTLAFIECVGGPNLYEELGKLREDDQEYEAKRKILMDAIDSLGDTPDPRLD